MKHPDRVFSFKELESEDDLVEAMTNHHWPICYGFYYSNHLYLGDGDSESDPEYAVTTVDKTRAIMESMDARWAGSSRRVCLQIRCARSSRRLPRATTPARIRYESRLSRSGITAAASVGWKRIEDRRNPCLKHEKFAQRQAHGQCAFALYRISLCREISCQLLPRRRST